MPKDLYFEDFHIGQKFNSVTSYTVTAAEIKEFCTSKYHVTFPMFAKISVKGADIHPLYQYLTDKQTDPQFGGDIKWNFNKFLIGRDGQILKRFDSKTTPDSDELTSAIQAALASK